ncbi:MAG: CHAP domain-containing protein [Cyanobacteria bacterium J06621_12]
MTISNVVTPNQVLQIAAREIGYKESPAGSNSNKFGRWYGMDFQPWCAMFVSYCFYNAGMPLPATKPLGFAYCPYGVKWFKDNGKWSNTPQVGDVVFFDWQNNGVADHVGIVETVNGDGSIIAIEGNTSVGNDSNGGQVMRRTRQRSLIDGFGKPSYGKEAEDSLLFTHPVWPGRYITLTSPHTQGNDVLTWQRQMIKRGENLGPFGSTKKGDDGVFGKRSHEILIEFQQANGLKSDGIIGPISWDKAWTIPITT